MPLGEERDITVRARRLVELAAAQAELDDLVDDANAVVTELVTNVLLHGSPPAELVVRADAAGLLRFEVSDASPVLPVRARGSREAMTGRGLALVDALTDRWGVQQRRQGKVVWAELCRGGVGELPELDPEELLAGWADLEPTDEQAREREPRFTVHLGEVPVDLLLAAKAHVDNLVREFALASTGARAGTTATVPPHLADLIDAVVHGFAGPRDAIKRQALAAAAAGQDRVRLELTLPVSAAEAGDDYLRALDQADDYCRAARLLTLESPPQHRVFRRWYVEELMAQLRRAASGEPVRHGETFEQRLLHEIDALAAAERVAERNARLHSLSSALTSAITPESVTHAVLAAGVATLRASGGAILLASTTSTLALPGALGYAEHTVARLRAESIDAELPAALAMRTRAPVWLESREERDRRFPALRGVEPETVSMCAVPLLVADRCLGALRFSFTEARLFDDAERDFVLTMAALSAQALDRAQLYSQRVSVSERLQRSLLPPRLPDIPGTIIESHYQPLGDGVDVGGDFYDVWPCDEDAWAFAIGDASGTGPEAAAMTALARHTLRALTLNDASLEDTLQHLNRALVDVHADADDERFCTVLLGRFTVEHDRALVALASGGHPDPIVMRGDGRVEELALRGSLLGLFPTSTTDCCDVELHPGDELVLYTDGVTDTRRGRRFFDVEGLIAAALAARAAGENRAAAISEAVQRHGRGQAGDDMAVLVLRYVGAS